MLHSGKIFPRSLRSADTSYTNTQEESDRQKETDPSLLSISILFAPNMIHCIICHVYKRFLYCSVSVHSPIISVMCVSITKVGKNTQYSGAGFVVWIQSSSRRERITGKSQQKVRTGTEGSQNTAENESGELDDTGRVQRQGSTAQTQHNMVSEARPLSSAYSGTLVSATSRCLLSYPTSTAWS